MEKIEARMIIEIMGRPKEHVIEALKMLVDKISKEQGVKMTADKIREPISVKESKDLFTSFAEIECEFDSLITCLRIVFTYLPSNIEIIKPESIYFRNEDITTIANAISARLHDYDAVTKKVVGEMEILKNKLKSYQAKEQNKK